MTVRVHKATRFDAINYSAATLNLSYAATLLSKHRLPDYHVLKIFFMISKMSSALKEIN